MFKKTLIASMAILIAAFTFAPVETSEAKTRVHIGVGIGGYGYGPYYDPYYGYGPFYGHRYGPYYGGYYGGYYPGPRYYVPRRHYRGRRISCKRAKRIVRNHGYRRVRARDCSGRNYKFYGRKRGRNYEIRMKSRNGRIYSVRRR